MSGRRWAVLLALWAGFFAWGVLDWHSGGPERYVGQHAGGVLVPLCGLGIAGAALGRRASTGGLLLRALAWGAMLAFVLLRLLGR